MTRINTNKPRMVPGTIRHLPLLLILCSLFFVFAANSVFAQTDAAEWNRKGNEYRNSGDYANAVTAYTEVIKLRSSYTPYVNRGICYNALENYNAAIADFTAAINISPNSNDEAHWYRSLSYLSLKNYDAAIADLTAVIKANSDFVLAYGYRGNAYAAKGIYHKEIADYRTWLEKGGDPNAYTVDKSSTASMWFCGAIYMDIVINRFLGNTAAVTKNENWLKTVCDNNNVTRAEVEAYYRNGIRALISDVVDEEFNRISFMLDTGRAISYNATLTRNPQNGQYLLSYGGVETNNVTRTVRGNSPDALISEMRNGSNKSDFTQLSMDQVRAQALLIPAVHIPADELNSIKQSLTRFFTDTTRNNFDEVLRLYNKHFLTGGNQGRAIAKALYNTVYSFNPALGDMLLR